MQAINSILNTNINTQDKNKLNTNTIDIDDKNKKPIDPRAVEYKATELLQKLGSPPASLEFFCKAFYTLPEQTVYRLAGLANEPQIRNKGAYFNRLVHREWAK